MIGILIGLVLFLGLLFVVNFSINYFDDLD